MTESGTSAPTLPLAVRIAGTGSYLPERIMTNHDLELSVDTSDEWITSRTGIRERRIAREDEFTSHMASEAAKSALEQAGIAAADIELIIVATITPDTLTPATACYVQQQIGEVGTNSCSKIDDSTLGFGTEVHGGWTMSWAQWANGGAGGSVCTRTLTYEVNSSRWIAG